MHTAKANSITIEPPPLTGGTEAVYYFHSDHLGSASWITSGTGLPVQHLLYLPFGEHFVNEQSSGYFERFTFTGKERDAETGYYYHGARFNSSDIGWLSVDPMADKYPSLTPYNYCAWNPVKFIDPDGEFKINIHLSLLKNANNSLKKSDQLSKIAYFSMRHSISFTSDIWYSKRSYVHLDNMKNFTEVQNGYNDAVSKFKTNMKQKKYFSAGVKLHTIMDFYSHSNYVDLYLKYKGDTWDPEKELIPTFEDACSKEEYSDFYQMLKNELRTGIFTSKSEDDKSNDPNSHHQMNLDSDNPKRSPNGILLVNNKIKKTQVAQEVATRDVANQIKNINND